MKPDKNHNSQFTANPGIGFFPVGFSRAGGGGSSSLAVRGSGGGSYGGGSLWAGYRDSR